MLEWLWICRALLSPLLCSESWRPACVGEPRSPRGKPACPGESVRPRSWLWTGCTCGTAPVSARPRTASRATCGRDPTLASESLSGRSEDTFCTSGRLPHPSLSPQDRTPLEEKKIFKSVQWNSKTVYDYTVEYYYMNSQCLPIFRKSERYWHVIPKPKSLQNPASFLWIYLRIDNQLW